MLQYRQDVSYKKRPEHHLSSGTFGSSASCAKLTSTLEAHSICDADLCAKDFSVGVRSFAFEELVCLALFGPEVLCTRVAVVWED